MSLSNKSTTDVYLLFMVIPRSSASRKAALHMRQRPNTVRCMRGCPLPFVFAVSRREFVRKRQLAVECVRRIFNRPSLLQLSSISMVLLYALMLYGVASYASPLRPLDSARAPLPERARFADAVTSAVQLAVSIYMSSKGNGTVSMTLPSRL
jgi:hypothetical protein